MEAAARQRGGGVDVSSECEAARARERRQAQPLYVDLRERLICCEICPDIKIVFINFEKV